MTKLEKVLYTAKAHTTGGRANGTSRTSDGQLEVKLIPPGVPGKGTNPEQLFAVGWSACFLSAIKNVAHAKKIKLPDDVAIDIEVDLGLSNGLHGLAARFNVILPGLDTEVAREVAEAAHHTCPYSLATRGNIEVATNVLTSQPNPVEMAHQ
jgi:Ohr subfamily peroxiredoxin